MFVLVIIVAVFIQFLEIAIAPSTGNPGNNPGNKIMVMRRNGLFISQMIREWQNLSAFF
jgi:hypothetical protein